MKKAKWGSVEKEFISQNADKMKDTEIADQLSALLQRRVSLQSVRKQRQKLGIQKAKGRGISKVVQKKSV